MDFDGGGDFAAFDASVYFFDETSGEFAIGVEQTKVLCEAAEIAGSETKPAAGLPDIGIETGVETGKRDFVEQSEIFGKR
jgi:hypothetical protein